MKTVFIINALFLSTLLLIGIVGVMGWSTVIRRWTTGSAAIDPWLQLPKPLGLIDVAAMFLLWVAGQIVAVTLAGQLLGIDVGETLEASGDQVAMLMALVSAGSLVFTGIGVLIVKVRFPQWSILGKLKDRNRLSLRMAGMAFCMVIPPILLLQWALSLLVPYEHSTLDVLKDNPSLQPLFAVWFSAVLAAPIYEEIFFRGMLQGWLQRFDGPNSPSLDTAIGGGWSSPESVEEDLQESATQNPSANVEVTSEKILEKSFEATKPRQETLNPYLAPSSASESELPPKFLNQGIATGIGTAAEPTKNWLPILLSALLFAAVHMGQGFAPVPLFFFGLALGYLYRQTGSILPCIFLHMGLNGFSMFWFTLQVFVGES